MTHYTTHEWRTSGVRSCTVVGDAERGNLRILIGTQPLTLPRRLVFATQGEALDAARTEQRRLVRQQLMFWRRFARREIGVTE